MIVSDVEQYSLEWFKLRCGLPTASSFDKIVTSKGEPSKQAQKYMFQIAGECISGVREETYKSEAMDRGTMLEPEARELYEIVSGNKVDQVGFISVEKDGKKLYGCSPDGLVCLDGLIEIKCPLIATQVGYLLDNKLPTDYVQQVQGQLLITGRKYTDFVSYFPGLRPLIVRVERDEVFIKRLAIELEIFCKNLEETVAKIQ